MSWNNSSKSNIQEQVVSILVQAFAIVGGATLLIQVLRAGNRSEAIDRAIYMFGLLTAAYYFFAITFARRFQVKAGMTTSAVALFALALGVYGVEQHDPINGVVLSNRLWLGFGPFVLVLMLFLAPMVWNIYKWNTLTKFSKSIFAFLAIASLALTTLSFWQDNRSVIDPDHSEYVLNEVLSLPAGNWPFSDFIPQYQTLFTFLIAPLAGTLAAPQITNLAFIMMFVSSILALLLAILLVRRTLPSRSIVLSVLLIVPFTAVTQFPIREGYLGSIASLLSGIAIRLFPGMVLISALLLIVSRLTIKKILTRVYLVGLGLLAGLNMWSSQDFGIAASLTVLILPVLLKYDENWKRLYLAVPLWMGIITGFAVYPIFSSIMGYKVNLDYFAFFARQFGGGFGAENIRTPGPVLVVLPLIISLIAAHTRLMTYSNTISDLAKRNKLFYTGLLGFSFSSWSALGFNYFLNRSYASGQLQILFLLISVSLTAFIGGYLQLQSETVGNSVIRLRDSVKIYQRINANLVVALLVSLPLASLLLSPNPAIELDRINSSQEAPRWPKSTVLASIADAKAGATWAKNNGVSVAFFGASANYVSKETGIKSASILNSPFDTLMSQQTIDTTCAFLSGINADYLVLSDEGAAMFRFKDNTLCERYAFADIPEVRSGRFAKKIG